MAKPLKTYLDSIPKDDIVSTIAGLITLGFGKDEIKAALPGLLDDLLPFPLLVPGPLGLALEAADGPILAALVEVLFPLFYRRAKAAAEDGESKRRIVGRVSSEV